MVSAKSLELQLEALVRDGIIAENSKEYMEWKKAIMDVRTEIDSLSDRQLEAFKEMLTLPSKVVTEKLGEIENAYVNLTSAINQNILATSAGQRNYEKFIRAMTKAEHTAMSSAVADKRVVTSSGRKVNSTVADSLDLGEYEIVHRTDKTNKYLVQNQTSGRKTSLSGTQMKELLGLASNRPSLATGTKFTVQAASVDVNATLAEMEAQSMQYSDYYTKGQASFVGANQAVMDDLARQRREAVLRTNEYLAAKELYMSIANDPSAKEEQIKAAKDNMEALKKTADESVASFAKNAAEALNTLIGNIQTYFGRTNGLIDSVNARLQSTREYITSIFGVSGKTSTIQKNLAATAENILEKYNGMNAELKVVVGQINEATRITGTFSKEDDEVVEAFTKAEEIQTQMVKTAQEYYAIVKERYNLPIEKAAEQLQKIANSYSLLTSVTSSNVLATQASQRAFANLAKSQPQLYAGLKSNIGAGETYIAQNAALRAQLDKTKDEYDVLSNALAETKKAYEKVKKDPNAYAEEVKAAQDAVTKATQDATNKGTELAA